MNKLYEKNEVTFAIILIIVYVIGTSVFWLDFIYIFA